MRLSLELNPGAQHDFVTGPEKFSAYIGGLGSGKTFAGIARGLAFSDQPRSLNRHEAPRGLIGSRYFPELRDVILPQIFKIAGQPGAKGSLIKDFKRQEMKIVLWNDGEILLRPLEHPDRLRGIEVCWAYFDEGRNLTQYAWDVVVGRLRQAGYRKAAFVGSTPNGFDWMWKLFHPDSPDHIEGATLYHAATMDNVSNVGQEYIDNLEARYGKDSPFYRQEVLGHFEGVTSGSVFPEWKPALYLKEIEYDPALPLYAGWDFGIGDLGVVVFVQINHIERQVSSGARISVPEVRVIDVLADTDMNVKQWADAFKAKCYERFAGRQPDRMYGDPAGRQRSMVTGTSVYTALRKHGINVTPARKQPVDLGLNIMKSLMQGGRLLVDSRYCINVSRAHQSHKWPVDEATGLRLGDKPVHDWTSHYIDAERYVLSQVVGLREFRRPKKEKRLPPKPGTAGAVFAEYLKPQADSSGWLE